MSADVTDTGLDCNGYVARPWIYEEKYHPTNWVTDRSIDFLRRSGPRKTFFPYGFLFKASSAFDAPEYYFNLYRSRELRPPFVGTWESDRYLKESGRIFDSKTRPH